MPSICIVRGCKSAKEKGNNTIHFHALPRDEETRKKWIELCDTNRNRTFGYVCSHHFESTAFERNLKYELLDLPVPPTKLRFKKGAVPTLQLPNFQKGAEPTQLPNLQKESVPTLPRPILPKVAVPTLQLPNFQKGAVPTLQLPNFQKGAVPTLQLPNFQKGAVPTLQLPNFQKGAVPTLQLPNFQKGAKPTLQLPHFQKGAKSTLQPPLFQKGWPNLINKCLAQLCYGDKVALLGEEQVIASTSREDQSAVENKLWKAKVIRDGLYKKNIIEALEKYAQNHPEVSVMTNDDGNCSSVIVVTDFMKRCHAEIENVHKICYVKSITHKNSSCNVVLLLGPSPVGAVPLGMVFFRTLEDKLIALIEGFTLLKETVGFSAFGGKLYPEAFVTDDEESVKAALGTVWPQSSHLVSSSHFLWNSWCTFADHLRQNATKVLRQEFMVKMKALILAKTHEDFEKAFQVLNDFSQGKNNYFLKYITNHLESKSEWSHAYQRPSIDMELANDCCEPILNIFKYICLERCKFFVFMPLLLYMSEIFCGYLQRRILDKVVGEKQKMLTPHVLGDHSITAESKGYFVMQFFMKGDTGSKKEVEVDLMAGFCSCQVKISVTSPCEHLVACAEVMTTDLPKSVIGDDALRKKIASIARKSKKELEEAKSKEDLDLDDEITIKHEVIDDTFVTDDFLTPASALLPKMDFDSEADSEVSGDPLCTSDYDNILHDPLETPLASEQLTAKSTIPYEEVSVSSVSEQDPLESSPQASGKSTLKRTMPYETVDVPSVADKDPLESDPLTSIQFLKKRPLPYEEVDISRVAHQELCQENPEYSLAKRPRISNTDPKFGNPEMGTPILIRSEQKTPHDNEVFGRLVTQKLSDIADENSVKRAKMEILKILSHAESGYLKNSIEESNDDSSDDEWCLEGEPKSKHHLDESGPECHQSHVTTESHLTPTIDLPEHHTFKRDFNFHNIYPRTDDNDKVVSTCVHSPIAYFSRYVSHKVLDVLMASTKGRYLSEKGEPLDIDRCVIQRFIACSFMMAVFRFPRWDMYWDNETSLPLIKANISKEVFSKIAKHLQLASALDVSLGAEESDKFWKFRPLIEEISRRCCELPRSKDVIVYEIIMPLQEDISQGEPPLKSTGYECLRGFVLAGSCGTVLDLEMFSSKKDLISSVANSGVDLKGLGDLTVGEAAVLRFVNSVPKGTSFYFDKRFTTPRLVETMASFGMGATGTLNKSLIPKECKLKTEQELRQQGKGASDSLATDDDKYCVTVWYDQKQVYIASNEHGAEPMSSCRRWCKEESSFVNIMKPKVIGCYSETMRGVDIGNQVVSYYRRKPQVQILEVSEYHQQQFVVQSVQHLLGLACANAWLEYKRDCNHHSSISIDSQEFMLQVAKGLVEFVGSGNDYSSESTIMSMVPTSIDGTAPIPSLAERTRRADHMPLMEAAYNKKKSCKYPGCLKQSRFWCRTCKVFLCVTVDRNCFQKFHSHALVI